MAASRIAISGLAVAGFSYAIHQHPLPLEFRSRLYLCQYLTFIDLWIQLAFHLLNMAVVPLPKLTPLRDKMYALVAFPVGMFVSIVFWALFLYDPAFMIPKERPFVIPTHVNHLLHTLPAVGLLTQALTTSHQYPKSISKGILATGAMALMYSIDLFCIYINYGHFPYPFLNMMEPVQVALFVGISLLFLFILYIVGMLINTLISRLYKKGKDRKQH